MGGSVYEGKMALVTGATGGIGKATALGLSRAGYRVAERGRSAASPSRSPGGAAPR